MPPKNARASSSRSRPNSRPVSRPQTPESNVYNPSGGASHVFSLAGSYADRNNLARRGPTGKRKSMPGEATLNFKNPEPPPPKHPALVPQFTMGPPPVPTHVPSDFQQPSIQQPSYTEESGDSWLMSSYAESRYVLRTKINRYQH